MEAVGGKTSVDKKKFTAVSGSLFRKKRVIRQTFTVSCDSLMTGGELLWPEGALRSSRAC